MLPEEQELNRLESEQAILEDQVANAELTRETLNVCQFAILHIESRFSPLHPAIFRRSSCA